MRRIRAKKITREKLLAAAEKTFVRTKFTAPTLQVARQAGVAHGTIFFHFANREELISAVARNLIGRITDALYRAYRGAHSLPEYLAGHFHAIRKDWASLQALWSGFSSFDPETKREIIALLSVMNYYTVEAFNAWSDHGLARTYLWQGALVYLSFFGDYMFAEKALAQATIDGLIRLISETKPPAAAEAGKTAAASKEMCRSCGMIFRSAGDHARSDPARTFCRWCADENGELKSFPEVWTVMTEFFQKTQGLNTRAARKAGIAVLSKNPAWREYLTRRSPLKHEKKEV
jgi:AcrR family transcriptional regulator